MAIFMQTKCGFTLLNISYNRYEVDIVLRDIILTNHRSVGKLIRKKSLLL